MNGLGEGTALVRDVGTDGLLETLSRAGLTGPVVVPILGGRIACVAWLAWLEIDVVKFSSEAPPQTDEQKASPR